jgi:hypothetical protein
VVGNPTVLILSLRMIGRPASGPSCAPVAAPSQARCVSIHEQEMRRAHAVGAREYGGKDSQQGDESAEEDDLAAVPDKEILADLETVLVKPDVPAVAHEQAEPDRAADHVAIMPPTVAAPAATRTTELIAKLRVDPA